jgi:hypothetical protein
VKRHKLASSEFPHIELLQAMLRTGKEVIVALAEYHGEIRWIREPSPTCGASRALNSWNALPNTRPGQHFMT